VNTVGMFFSVRKKKLPFRLLQERWLEVAAFAGFGIHAATMVKPKRGGSAFSVAASRVAFVCSLLCRNDTVEDTPYTERGYPDLQRSVALLGGGQRGSLRRLLSAGLGGGQRSSPAAPLVHWRLYDNAMILF
jgi:hypothetical protein